VIEDDSRPDPSFPQFLDSMWLAQLPSFDILKLTGDVASRQEFQAVPIATRAGRRICAPLHPSYASRCYIISRQGAARALRRLGVIDDSSDVMMFRRPMTSMRFLDVRPVLIETTNAESTLHADRWHNAPAPWWRPLLSWAPHRLALMERKARRFIAFLRAQGFAGFRRLEVIPLDAQPAAPQEAGARPVAQS
jgi:hypothetical protein